MTQFYVAMLLTHVNRDMQIMISKWPYLKELRHGETVWNF